MEQKHWYESKIVWAGIIETLVGILTLVADWLRGNDYSPASVVALIAGIFIIVSRIWFTDTVIATRRSSNQ